MQSGASIVRQHRRTVVFICVAVALVAVLAGSVATRLAGDARRSELSDAARETLLVQVQALNGLMEKFRLLPNLIARYDSVGALLDGDEDQTGTARRALQQISAVSGALDIALLSARGDVVIAARNLNNTGINPQGSLMGAVVQGRLGREVRQIGQGRQAYVFAHGIRGAGGALKGVVAVFVDLATLEQVWSLTTNPVFVADQAGTIIVSNRQQWRMRPQGEMFDAMAADGETIDVSHTLPQLNWTMHVLAGAAPVAQARLQAGAAVAVVALALASALVGWANRQLSIHQTRRRERATALRLERTVRDRTRELTRTNTALAEEVRHHKQTETALRQTQAELIQTGKLAALGQMSTALSHEYNQPLAATKSYADNALVFLDRGRVPEARENIVHISGMADRMAAISKHLRNFARKPNVAFGSVPIATVIDDALSVMSARVRESGAEIKVEHGCPDLWVRGGHVRLQQVLVNLVTNGLDAMAGNKHPHIIIQTEEAGERVLVSVRDFGTGIPGDIQEKIFDPFFTTKGPGGGLGLGLSISYNIVKDFGGRLTAETADGGGTVFTVELQRGDHAAKAAE